MDAGDTVTCSRLVFRSYGLVVAPQDVGAFIDIIIRAQPCDTYYDVSSNTTRYKLKPRTTTTFDFVPTHLLEYPTELMEAVQTVREGTKEGSNG